MVALLSATALNIGEGGFHHHGLKVLRLLASSQDAFRSARYPRCKEWRFALANDVGLQPEPYDSWGWPDRKFL